MNNWAKVLKSLRKDRGLSQADLANLLGVRRSSISSYENGTRSPDYDTLLKIAACFQVSIDYLLCNYGPHSDSSSKYSKVLSELNRLLVSSPITEKQKNEILNEIQDYFRWKIEQARLINPSEEEE